MAYSPSCQQRANTTDGISLASIIANESFRTFYAELSFDTNGQSSAGALLLQYDSEGIGVQPVYPAASASRSLIYPAPTWAYRDCARGGNCSWPFGHCTDGGACDCDGELVPYYDGGVYICRLQGCNTGEHVADSNCTPCEPGSYQPDSDSMAEACMLCEPGHFAPIAGSGGCVLCANGEVTLERGSARCRSCPLGAKCENTSTVTVKPGMWRHGTHYAHPYSIHACPIEDACPGGSGFGEDLCAKGFVGPLCTHCGRRYTIDMSGTICQECGMVGNHGNIALVVGLAIVVLIASYRRRLLSTAAFQTVSEARRIAKVKLRTIFFSLQVSAIKLSCCTLYACAISVPLPISVSLPVSLSL